MMTQLLRPSSRGQRSAWLTVHLFGAVGWVGAVAGSLALGMGITAWPVDAHAVAALNHLIAVVTWWVTVTAARQITAVMKPGTDPQRMAPIKATTMKRRAAVSYAQKFVKNALCGLIT